MPRTNFYLSPSMSRLAEHIHQLLYDYDCVIVPELGGFIADHIPARIDERLHLIMPPSKELRFNASLKKNDGLLAQTLADADSITHEQANEIIRKAVEDHFNQLNAGERVVFEKVGILYLDSHRNIRFKADDSINYLLDAFGLKRVYAHPVSPAKHTEPSPAPVVEEKEQVVPAPVVIEPEVTEEEPVKETPVIPIDRPSRKTQWWAAALIPLLLYVGFVTYRGGVFEGGRFQLSDLNPFQTQTEARFEARETSDVKKTPEARPTFDDDSSHIRLATDGRKIPLAPLVEEMPKDCTLVHVEVPRSIILRYHIIGGCFGEKSNADRMVRGLQGKGFDAYILDQKNGLHRVVYGSYPDKSTALEVLPEVKAIQSEAWLLRKEVRS